MKQFCRAPFKHTSLCMIHHTVILQDACSIFTKPILSAQVSYMLCIRGCCWRVPRAFAQPPGTSPSWAARSFGDSAHCMTVSARTLKGSLYKKPNYINAIYHYFCYYNHAIRNFQWNLSGFGFAFFKKTKWIWAKHQIWNKALLTTGEAPLPQVLDHLQRRIASCLRRESPTAKAAAPKGVTAQLSAGLFIPQPGWALVSQTNPRRSGAT